MDEALEQIVEFDGVSWSRRSHRFSAVSHLSFGVGPGEQVLIRPEGLGDHLPLCELAEGLIRPDSGVVRFEGRNWEETSGGEQSRMRGHIGRVFEGQAWVSNLSVYENIALSPRHHGTLSETEISERVTRLASAAGILDIISLRPDQVHRRELLLAQWVRAFLGNPKLILLQQPAKVIRTELHTLLLDWVRSALDGGSAVVWITSSDSLWRSSRLKSAWRFTMSNGTLEPIREDE